MAINQTIKRFCQSIIALIALLCLVQSLEAITISEYIVPTPSSGPVSMTMGPDNSLWFVEYYGNRIGRIDPITHAITEYSIPTPNSGACNGITTGPDGAIWFTEGGGGDTADGANRIGRIDPTTHAITDYPTPTAGSGPAYITSGSDGALWFTEQFSGKIGRIDPNTHVITEYATPTPNSDPWGITSGPDGAIWFTEANAGQIGRLDPTTHAITEYALGTGAGCIIVGSDGAFWIADHHADRIVRFDPATRAVTTYSVLTANSNPDILTSGPDGAIWFTETDATKIGRLDPITHIVTEYSVPTSNSFPAGLTPGPDGALWFAEALGNKIARATVDPVPSPKAALYTPLLAGGVSEAVTVGTGSAAASGYAVLNVNSGNTPYGTAVFRFMQNGVTVTEAGVPASPTTTSARVFIDYRNAVNAIPGRNEAGKVNINTGIAVVNYGFATANVTYTLRDLSGNPLSTGHGTIAAGNHFACFIDGLANDVAPDFNLPADFQSNKQFGTLEISSDQPLSILALRGTNNQRNDFLITTTPIADLSKPSGSSPIYFPQFVDGGGYTTSLVLLNTSDATETGTVQILDKDGNPLVVNQVGGTTNSSFTYTIPPGGAYHFQTDGSPSGVKAGWARLTPNASSWTPNGAGIFSYNPADMLLSESGIPSAVATTHARIFVDLSENHNTGLAIANVSSAAADIAITAFQTDGITPVGTSQGPLQLAGNGYNAAFADSFITGLPAGFGGVLDISSTTPFAALTLRSLNNERNDFLMTTFPIADQNQAAPSPVIFPQIADGGGYMTQFILINRSQSASATLSFYDNNGALLAVGK
jgi:virginiamycin B lyase